MVMIDVGDPKMAREMLCRAQNALIHYKGGFSESEIARLGKMIDQIDVLRPLGPDGKHGNRHTDNCGCDGEIDWRNIPGFPGYQVDSTGRLRDNNGYLQQLNTWPGVMPEPYYKLEVSRQGSRFTPKQLVSKAFYIQPTEWSLMKATDD